MAKKWPFIVFGLLIVFVVAGLAAVVLVPESRFENMKANFDRIKIGMTLEEVDVIFGEERGIENNFAALAEDERAFWWAELPNGPGALVVFKNNLVKTKTWGASDETPFQKIGRRLGFR